MTLFCRFLRYFAKTSLSDRDVRDQGEVTLGPYTRKTLGSVSSVCFLPDIVINSYKKGGADAAQITDTRSKNDHKHFKM